MKVKLNKNKIAKGTATGLTCLGSGAMWAAGARVALKTNYHPVIKLAYFVGSMATGCLLQMVTKEKADQIIDELWPEDEANIEIEFGTEETGSY